MTISVRGVNNAAGQANGNTASSDVATVVTAPTGLATGDRVFICAVSTTSTTLSANGTGWTDLSGDIQLGSGAVAAGSGLRRMRIWYRDKDASWSTMPTVACTTTTNNSLWIGAIAATPTAGSIFSTPSVIATPNQSYNGATTNYSDATSGNALYGNPMALYFTGLNDNVTSTTAVARYVTTTVATLTEQCDGGTATGNDVAGKIHSYIGTPFALATSFNLTLSAASQGETFGINQDEFVPVAFSTLADRFSAHAPNPSLWAADSGITQSGGKLHVGDGVAVSPAMNSGAYTLVGSAFYFQVGDTFGGSFNALAYTGSSLYGWSFTGTSAQVQNSSGGGASGSITHVPGNFYRTRESGGMVFWDYSIDKGVNWTTLTSVAPATPVNNLTFVFQAIGTSAGIFDNFNVLPEAKTETLIDDCSSLSNWFPVGATATVSGGVFTIPGVADQENYILSGNPTFVVYDIIGSSLTFKVNQISSGNDSFFGMFDANTGYGPSFDIIAPGSGSGVTSSTPIGTALGSYDPTTHPYLRISESGGTLTYAKSADNVSWTTMATEATLSYSIEGTTTTGSICISNNTGRFSSTGDILLDAVNPPPPPTNGNFFAFF